MHRVYDDYETKMKVVTCNLPKPILKSIERLIRWGLVPSRSEYVRRAVINQLIMDMDFKRKTDNMIEDENIDPRLYVKIPNGDGTHNIRKVIRRLE